LGPDSQCWREPPVRVGKKGRIEDSMLNVVRNDGINNSFEPPIGDKYEIL
jgi:hypothetical protein